MKLKPILYINIFVNVVITSAYLAPGLVFPIDYNSQAYAAVEALQTDSTFYLLASVYANNLYAFYRFMLFFGILITLISICNSVMILRKTVIMPLLYAPVMMALLSWLFFPPGIEHWAFNLLGSIAFTIDTLLLGAFVFKDKIN